MLNAASAPDSANPGLFGELNELARHTGWLHVPMQLYAGYGVVIFALLLIAGCWVARIRGPRTMAAALWVGTGTLLAVALNQPIVNRVHEARPYSAHPNILVLAHRSADYSFPSDHAVMAGAVAAGLWLVTARLGAVATLAACLMAFSRVYIAAHYPHDVLVGLALGAGIVLLGWLLVATPLTRLVEWLAGTLLRPLLIDDWRAPDDVRSTPRRRPRRLPV